MANYPPESQRFTEDYSGQPSYWPVDRRAEADSFLDRLDKNPGKPLFVHGRRDVGKTSLLAYHVSRRLADRGDNRIVQFGRLQIDGAATIEFDDSENTIEAMISQDCIVCVDQFHQLFVLPAYKQLKFMDSLHAQINAKECTAAVVFLLDDDAIGDLMALNTLRPDFVDVMFQVRSVDVIESVRQIVTKVAGSSDWLSDKVLECVANDAVQLLPDATLGISPRFPAIVASRLMTVHAEEPDTEFSVPKYVEGGRLQGVLEGYVASELDRLSETGLTTVETLWRIMDEMVIADPVGGVIDIDALAARLDVSQNDCLEILETVRNQSGIIRKIGSGAYRPAPSQLYTVLRTLTRERRQQMGLLQAEVAEHAETGLTHGTALPMAILKRVLRNQYDLHFSQRATQFVLDWVLRTRLCSLDKVRYWLKRIKDDELRLDIITTNAFDPDKDARLKATKLLLEYEVPEAKEILLNLVIQDSQPDVRTRAIEQLAITADESTRQSLYAAARVQGSNYRINAVRALVIFPDEPTVELLIEISGTEHQPELARVAMDVMADIPTDGAVSGLTDIALQSEVADRREAAGSALRRISQSEQIGKVIDAIHGWRVRREEQKTEFGVIGRFLRTTGNFFLGLFAIFLNVLIPGIVLIFVRHYRSGIVFALLSIATYAGVVFPVSYMLEEIFFTIRMILFVASLVWAGTVLLTSDSQFIWKFGALQRIVRAQIIFGLVLTAFIWDYLFLFLGTVLLPVPHGIFHLMVKNWRRAARIFSFQLLALGFWFVGQYQSGIIYDDSPIWFAYSAADLNTFGSRVYMTIWYVIFVGTLLWDVIGVLLGRLILARWIYRRARRKELLAVLLTERAYVDYLVSEVCGSDRKAADRAAKLLVSHGDHIPPTHLLYHAETDNKILRRTLEKSLAKATSLAAVSQLADSMPSKVGLTQTMIVRALVSRPTPQSLQALKEHSADVPAKERRRLYWGNSNYTARLLATPPGLTVMVIALWGWFLIWEGSNTLMEPHRAIEKYVLRNCQELTWQSASAFNANRQLSWAQQRASSASYMAERMLESGIDNDVRNIEKTLEQVHARQCGETDDDAALLIRLAALGGLAHLASRHPVGHQALPVLDSAPAETIRLGLQSSLREVRRTAIKAVSRLSVLQPPVGVFDPNEREQISQLLGKQLNDRKLEMSYRQSAIDVLQAFGGTAAIESLKDFVLKSDSTFSSPSQQSGFLSRNMQAGLGISGQLLWNATLAKHSIEAMGKICKPAARASLTEIKDSKGGNLRDFATKALEEGCLESGVLVFDAPDPAALSEEIFALTQAFAREEYRSVAIAAEFLLDSGDFADDKREENIQLLFLAGRANYQLSLLDPSLTLEYWAESEYYLNRYFDLQMEKDAQPDADAVYELAQSRLGLARSHMDTGWLESMSPEEQRDEFEHAREYLDKITEESFLQQIQSIDTQRYNQVMSLAWAFKAAALIDGSNDYVEALKLLELSLQSNDQFWWAYYLQALSRYSLDDPAGAFADSVKSLDLNPNYGLTYRLIYQLRTEFDAVAVLTEVKKNIENTDFEDTPWPNFYLAVLYHEYLAPQKLDASALDDFQSAFEEMTLYAKKVDISNDPLINIQWLELAITSGNLEREEIRQIREVLAKQSAGQGKVEIIASYFLALAALLEPTTDSEMLAAQQIGTTELEFLDNLLRTYRNLEAGSETLWETAGIRHYILHCQEWQRCDIDDSLAAEISKIAEIFEQVKSDESTAALEKSIEALKQWQVKANLPGKSRIIPAV